MAEPRAAHELERQEAPEDEEDDYMGDLSKFIPAEAAEPSKPKKIPITTSGKPLISSQSTRRPKNPKLEREKKQFEEDQQTLANLTTAIPQSNIGFKLLKQMGYTPGSALGKEGSGRAEPVGLEIRRSRAGIGREDPLKEKAKREKDWVERKRRREEELIEEFGSRQKSQWRIKRVVINYHKAKAALDQLENREPPIEPEKDENEEKSDDEEEEEIISEEDLLDILLNLREQHWYCLFCGFQYESTEALVANCPGVNEDDH